jgi:protein SCO1/2
MRQQWKLAVGLGGVMIALGIAGAFYFFLPRTSQQPTVAGESLFQLNLRFQNQHGQSITLADLKGKTVIMAMAYTGCQYTCPLILQKMKDIEAELAKRRYSRPVRFVLVSLDTDYDTPAVLAAFANTYALPAPAWQLWHTDEETVSMLAAILGVRYRQNGPRDFDHNILIAVLNKNGILVHSFTDLNESVDTIVTTLKPLI